MACPMKAKPAGPTRHQPSRSAKSAVRKGDQAEPHPVLKASKQKGVQKKAGAKAKQASKSKKGRLQQILVERVDQMDQNEAWAEQAQLLGLDISESPTSPTKSTSSHTKGYKKRRATKYMDDFLDDKADKSDDDLSAKWIPRFEHRKRPVDKPASIPYAVWMAYQSLDDLVYRHSLTAKELESFPLLADVHEYQDSKGRSTKPMTPPGYQWDENLELQPTGYENHSKTPELSSRMSPELWFEDDE